MKTNKSEAYIIEKQKQENEVIKLVLQQKIQDNQDIINLINKEHQEEIVVLNNRIQELISKNQQSKNDIAELISLRLENERLISFNKSANNKISELEEKTNRLDQEKITSEVQIKLKYLVQLEENKKLQKKVDILNKQLEQVTTKRGEIMINHTEDITGKTINRLDSAKEISEFEEIKVELEQDSTKSIVIEKEEYQSISNVEHEHFKSKELSNQQSENPQPACAKVVETTKSQIDDLQSTKATIAKEKKLDEIFKVIKDRIKNGITLNDKIPIKGYKRITFIYYIVEFGTYKQLEVLLKNGADPNTMYNNQTLISKCIDRVKLEQSFYLKIKLLLKYGADINKVDYLNNSIKLMDFELTNFLLENGAHFKSVQYNKQIAYSERMVTLFEHKGIDDFLNRILERAIQKRDFDVVEYWIDKKSNIDLVLLISTVLYQGNNKYYTNTPTLNFLLLHLSKKVNTPIQECMMILKVLFTTNIDKTYYETIGKWINRNITKDIDLVNKEGNTLLQLLLHLLLSYRNYIETSAVNEMVNCAIHLIQKGANVELKDSHGSSSQDYIIKLNNKKLVQVCLEQGADDKDYINYILKNFDEELFRLLLKNKIHLSSEEKVEFLKVSISNAKYGIVKKILHELIEEGISNSTIEKVYKKSIENKDITVCKMLLDNSLNPNQNQLQSVLLIAYENEDLLLFDTIFAKIFENDNKSVDKIFKWIIKQQKFNYVKCITERNLPLTQSSLKLAVETFDSCPLQKVKNRKIAIKTAKFIV